MRAIVAWRGGLWLTEGEVGVLSMCFLFLLQVGVYVCVCVCICMHTHTAGYSDVSQGVGMRLLEGPNNSDGQNLGICVFISVYKVHMCMCMLGGGMRSWIK